MNDAKKCVFIRNLNIQLCFPTQSFKYFRISQITVAGGRWAVKICLTWLIFCMQNWKVKYMVNLSEWLKTIWVYVNLRHDFYACCLHVKRWLRSDNLCISSRVISICCDGIHIGKKQSPTIVFKVHIQMISCQMYDFPFMHTDC